MIKLKDFILDEIPTKEKVKKEQTTQPEYVFTLEYENDVDFILRRTTSRTDRSLVCIVSQGQIYVKDNKTNDIELVSMKDQLTRFKSGMTVDQKPKFEKLTWAPFDVNNNWVNGRYVDTVCINYHFERLLKNKDAYKILANKKLNPFKNDDLVKEYLRNPEAFDATNRLIDAVKLFYPSFSLSYRNSSTILHSLRNINFQASIVLKNKAEFDTLGETFLNVAKWSSFSQIFTDYNVDFSTWLKWFTYTIINNNHLDVSNYSGGFSITDYLDYLRMQKEMYGKVKEKYPKYWLSEEHILTHKYNDWKTLRSKIGFELNQEPLKAVEYKNDIYQVMVPLMSSDIIDEAHQQHHCVASYIDSVARGDTHIVFIRKVDKPEESVLTVEINTNNEVCQVRGFYNRDYTLEEYNFMKEWAKETGLTLTIKEKKDESETEV